MRAIFETLFDIFYLLTVLSVGIRMIRNSKGSAQFQLFGWMAVVLGAGDSFHLVPRALALCTTGLDSYAFQLGLGKWITSVTMTVFYVLLYYVWRQRYHIQGQKAVTWAVYALSGKKAAVFPTSSNGNTFSQSSTSTSLITARHSSGRNGIGFPFSFRCSMIFGHGPCLNPSVRIRSTPSIFFRNSSGSTVLLSISTAFSEEIRPVTSAPALVKRSLSFPS